MRGRPRTDIRARVVRAARDRFLRQGVDGASLRGIAAAAGTSIGMVYYYFPTKDALFLAAVEDAYAVLLEGIRAALAGDAPVAVRLRRLFERIWRMDQAEYATVRLILREAMISSSRVKKVAPRFLQGHLPLLLALLEEGRARGELRSDVPLLAQLAAILSLGMMPVIARRIAAGAAPPDFPFPPAQVIAPALSSVLLRGIGRPGRRGRAA